MPPHGVGRPEIHHYAFPLRVPPGFPVPTVVPGAASGVRDMLLLLLPPLFTRCPGATAMYVLLLFCSAAISSAAALSAIYVFAADPRVSMFFLQVNSSL